METKRYPFRYFLFLLVALVLAILFWLFVFPVTHNTSPAPERSSAVTGDNQRTGGHWNPELLPEENGQIVPVDTSKIIADTLNKRKIVSNIVNIAVKNASGSILGFANDLKKHYPSDAYKIIYIDSVINRLQLKLPDNERVTFKNEVKNKLSNYSILVWDEILFDYVKNFNDPKLRDKDASWYLKATNIEKYWDKTTGNPNIVIAVVDNGFDLSHPELIGKSVKPYNVIDKSTDVSPAPINHGTHVASVIVAKQNNNQGIVGVCSSCRIMPIKVEDQNGRMSNSYVIDAILYAIKNKAAVVNLSLGMFIPGNVSIPSQAQQNYINSSAKDEEQFWNDLFDYADKNKVTCVLAAGNSNILTGFDPFQRAVNTIKVGAITQELSKAQFSNYGSSTTIYAPGVGIYGAKTNNNYEYLNGTSMAAPIVSGFIGLLKSENKNLSNSEIIKLLKINSTQINNLPILKLKN